MIDILKIVGIGCIFILPTLSQYILGSTYKINMFREFIHLFYTVIISIFIGIIVFITFIPQVQELLIILVFILYVLLGFVNILLNNLKRTIRIVYLLVIILLETLISIAFVYSGLI